MHKNRCVLQEQSTHPQPLPGSHISRYLQKNGSWYKGEGAIKRLFCGGFEHRMNGVWKGKELTDTAQMDPEQAPDQAPCQTVLD